MRINDQPVPMPPHPAATVVLLRDAANGMEVFMVKRHGLSDVLGGAYVFPGGKVDPGDTDPKVLEELAVPLHDLRGALGEPELDTATAAGLYVAACRETFEEAGVLLAEGATAQHVEIAQTRAREAIPFGEILAGLELRLDLSNIVPWSRWITPRVPTMLNKRFDARFFLAAVPNDQKAQHDDHEATGSFWLRPRVVLEQYWSRRLNLAPAQIMSLAALARHPHVADVIAAARGRRPPVILPEPFSHEQLRAIAFPGNEQHPIVEPALPGPSFLVYRNERFEPLGGFETLFG